MGSRDDASGIVLDALFNRRAGSESCLVSNESGRRLLEPDRSDVSAIEHVVVTTVQPVMEEHAARHGLPDPYGMFREGPPFAGLDYVLGAYWAQNARTDPARAVGFMKERPWSVVAESVLALVAFFNPRRPLAGVPLPPEYREYLSTLVSSGVPAVEKLAAYAIDRLRA